MENVYPTSQINLIFKMLLVIMFIIATKKQARTMVFNTEKFEDKMCVCACEIVKITSIFYVL